MAIITKKQFYGDFEEIDMEVAWIRL